MKTRPRSMIKYLTTVALLFVGGNSFAECDPREILSRDSTQLYWTEQTQRLFLLSATSEQYNKVTQSWKSGGSYGPFSGYLNFSEAKEAARRESKYLKIAEDGSQNLAYLTQTLNADAAGAFVACLKLQKESPGIRIWLSSHTDDRYELQAYWVGSNAGQGSAKLVSITKSDGTKVISVPKVWTKGNVQSIWIQKAADVTGDITVEIGDLVQTFVLQKELPRIEFANEEVFGDYVELESCHYLSRDSTARASHSGGYLIPSMTQAQIALAWGYNTQQPVISHNDFLSATILFATETTGCERLAHVRGRTRAVERFPVPLTTDGKGLMLQ